MHILFLTTVNLATNPRLVKELKVAIAEGYKVTVVCFRLDNWSRTLNESILADLQGIAAVHEISAERMPFFPWMLSTLVQVASGYLLKLFPANAWLLSAYCSKRSVLLLHYFKKLKETIHLVVAHNPGAFYPAFSFARRKVIPFGIDIEDYHPGETEDTTVSGRMKTLLRQVLPSAAYISAAAPLILDHSLADIGHYPKPAVVINNFFPATEFIKQEIPVSGPVKIVWFSQNIDRNRGLEYIIPVVRDMADVELHLYGNLRQDFFNKHLYNVQNIIIHEPLPQEMLHRELVKYDVGLAIEDAGSNFNRDICITNKLLAYFQSGLYILATDTTAQQKFLNEHPGCGILNSKEKEDLTNSLAIIKDGIEEIRTYRNIRVRQAMQHCWENEFVKLTSVWTETIELPKTVL